MSTAGAGRRPGLPALVRPMLATPGELPSPDQDLDWGYELKWDGVRAIAYLDGGPLRLLSRNDRDVAAAYPELVGLSRALGDVAAVLDGEVVSFDPQGRTSFGRLQERMHVRDLAAARRLSRSVPVVYLVFDVLHLDGGSTLELPYRARRDLLDGLALTGPAWQTPPWFAGGPDLIRASREQRFEGIVAKRLSSPYRPGRRSPDWLKIKHVRAQAVVVVGWRPGQGRRAGGIGSLVLAVGGPDGLRHVGGVGTGFTERSLAELGRRLAPHSRDTPPLPGPFTGADVRDVRWVEPVLVGEVAFAEWTQDGHLRHPSWRGLRPELSPDQVVPED